MDSNLIDELILIGNILNQFQKLNGEYRIGYKNILFK
jgi:hypothetical protein